MQQHKYSSTAKKNNNVNNLVHVLTYLQDFFYRTSKFLLLVSFYFICSVLSQHDEDCDDLMCALEEEMVSTTN